MVVLPDQVAAMGIDHWISDLVGGGNVARFTVVFAG